MENGKSFAPQPVVAALLNCGALKTWSVIVTILGDLSAAPGARVPGPVLSALTEGMGMKPEAMRVALHRLRRDGWIQSERDGRSSLYGLTDHGRALTLSVSQRVYGDTAPPPDGWQIVLAPTAEAMQGLDHPDVIILAPRAALLPDGAAAVPDTFLAWAAIPGAVPDWARQILAPAELAAAYATLSDALELALQAPVPRAPIDRAVLRVLALHQWRRLVLRHGPGPEALMGRDWPGALARTLIARLLERLDRPDPAILTRALSA